MPEKDYGIKGDDGMAQRLVRIGKVSKINYEKGMIRVTYPDLDDSVTAEFPVFSFTDEYKMPKIGQEVLVLHLSNGQSAGILIGKYWNKKNVPPAYGQGKNVFNKEIDEEFGKVRVTYKDKKLTLYDEAGDVDMEIKSADRNVRITGGDININVTGGAVNVIADNGVHIKGEVTVTGDATIGGKSFLGHTHTGVHGNTTPPN